MSESPILIHFHKGPKIRVVWEERCKNTVERRSRKGPKIEEILSLNFLTFSGLDSILNISNL